MPVFRFSLSQSDNVLLGGGIIRWGVCLGENILHSSRDIIGFNSGTKQTIQDNTKQGNINPSKDEKANEQH